MSRHAAVRRAFLVTFGIETPEKAFAKIATVVIAAPIALAVGWFYPVEPWWGKLLQGLGSLVVAMAIIYLWTHLTLKMPAVNVGLSPLYTALGFEQFRSEQRAKDAEIARLTSASQQLAAAMTKLHHDERRTRKIQRTCGPEEAHRSEDHGSTPTPKVSIRL